MNEMNAFIVTDFLNKWFYFLYTYLKNPSYIIFAIASLHKESQNYILSRILGRENIMKYWNKYFSILPTQYMKPCYGIINYKTSLTLNKT